MRSRRTLLGLAVAGVIAVVGAASFRRWYFERMDIVAEKVQAIAGTRVVRVWANYELEIEEISVELAVSDGSIAFYGVEPQSFEGDRPVIVEAVDGMQVAYISCPPRAACANPTAMQRGFGVDVAQPPEGALDEVRIRNLTDALENLGLLRTALLEWPRCPLGIRDASDGWETLYCLAGSVNQYPATPATWTNGPANVGPGQAPAMP